MNRRLSLNNNVLYLKVYIGTLKSDELLTDLYSTYNISDNPDFEFFFIRYSDPEPHLRFRFFFKNQERISFYLESILKYLGDYPFVRNIAIDNYHRELERYGVNNMENCEELFFTDSHNVALMVVNTLEDLELRFRLGLGMFSFYLEYCFEDTKQIMAYLKTVRESYRGEFRYDNEIKNCISKHHRNMFSQGLLSDDNETINQFLTQHVGLEQYKDTLTRIIRESTIDSLGLVCSLIHMFFNRLFPSYQRELEYLAYELMVRLYRTRMSLESKQLKNNILPCNIG